MCLHVSSKLTSICRNGGARHYTVVYRMKCSNNTSIDWLIINPACEIPNNIRPVLRWEGLLKSHSISRLVTGPGMPKATNCHSPRKDTLSLYPYHKTGFD